ncbi:uncharacterized protein LOC111100879, partial [Crassostrea virginica]
WCFLHVTLHRYERCSFHVNPVVLSEDVEEEKAESLLRLYEGHRLDTSDSDDSSEVEPDPSLDGGRTLPLAEDVLLRRNFIFLKDELSLRWLHDHLYQNEVISVRDLEVVCHGSRPRHEQVDALLKLLLRHGRPASSRFVQILPDCGYRHVLNVFHETTDFKCKEEWMVYQNEIHVDHIKAEHAFLARTIEPVPTADCILQELTEEAFSVTDHDEIQNEISKSKQANVLLAKIAKNNGVVLNCFLHAVEKIRHVLPGTSILKRLKSSVPVTGRPRKQVGVYFQDEHLLTVVDLNYDDDRGDHVIILKFRNRQRRAIQELENVLVRRIHNLDSEIDELANRFMHMSIQDGEAGSIVLYVKALTDRATDSLDKNHLKAFIQHVLHDPQINRLLPAGTLQLQVETITSGFVEGEMWEIERGSLTEILADNRPMLEDELEPFCFLPRFQREGVFSQAEVEATRKQGSRRNRANEFLRLLQAKKNPAMDIFVDEMEKLGETYILQQLFPSAISDQCKECLRNAILHNYEDIRDEIDVRIAEYTDPLCHAACEQYKDSSDRYRSPQALLKHVLECETALVRFKKVTRSTPIAGLTESDCTCSGFRDLPPRIQRKKHVYNFRISSVLQKDNPPEKKKPPIIQDLLPTQNVATIEKSTGSNNAVAKGKKLTTKKVVRPKRFNFIIEKTPLNTNSSLTKRFPVSKTKSSRKPLNKNDKPVSQKAS